MSTNVLVDSPYETQDPKSISKSAGQAKESQSTPTELIDIITCMKIFAWQGTNRQMDTRETKPLFTNKWSLMGSGPFGEVVQCYKRSDCIIIASPQMPAPFSEASHLEWREPCGFQPEFLIFPCNFIHTTPRQPDTLYLCFQQYHN